MESEVWSEVKGSLVKLSCLISFLGSDEASEILPELGFVSAYPADGSLFSILRLKEILARLHFESS